MDRRAMDIDLERCEEVKNCRTRWRRDLQAGIGETELPSEATHFSVISLDGSITESAILI